MKIKISSSIKKNYIYAPMRFAVYTVFDHACLLRPPHQNFLDTALYRL